MGKGGSGGEGGWGDCYIPVGRFIATRAADGMFRQLPLPRAAVDFSSRGFTYLHLMNLQSNDAFHLLQDEKIDPHKSESPKYLREYCSDCLFA